jgi:hypothetical protein
VVAAVGNVDDANGWRIFVVVVRQADWTVESGEREGDWTPGGGERERDEEKVGLEGFRAHGNGRWVI